MAEKDSGRVDLLLKKLEERKEQHRADAEERARVLAILDAEDEAERKEEELRRKRATRTAARTKAGSHKPGHGAGGRPNTADARSAAVPEAAYWALAGSLGSFRHAMHLHPHEQLAATGSALGSISIWSQHLPPRAGQEAEAAPATAAGDQQWHLVDQVGPGRSSGKEIVLALTFIPNPLANHPRATGSEVFLASASSDRTIKIWSGPAHAPTASPLARPHGDDQQGGAADGAADGSAAPIDKVATQVQKKPRVRLTMQPHNVGGNSCDGAAARAQRKDMLQLLSSEIAAALNIPPARGKLL